MPEPASAVPPTILVVDDDEDMRFYLRGCLRRLGSARVVEAADGREALDLARALRPDLVVSDVVMPGLDGPGLCRALKADPDLARIPVLLITGEHDNPDVADAFLEKPFDTNMLRASVTALLDPPT